MKRSLGGLWAMLLVLSIASVASVGCASDGSNDPILRLAAEESLDEGKELMEQKKWLRARDYLLHAFEVAPNSVVGRDALLLVADSHYLAGGDENFIKAEAKYRDFQNRFPTSDRSDYVQYKIASSLSRRILRPDRDQKATREALASFQDLVALYPTSEYVAEAQEQIQDVRDHLAESEYLKGFFHLKSMRLPLAASHRFETVLEDYPNYSKMDRVLFNLGKAYARLDQTEKARTTWDRLRTEHPESPLSAKIPKLPPPKETESEMTDTEMEVG